MGTPQLWGIINLTPDSFFEGSRAQGGAALERAEAMLQAGAAMVDVGAESTRPGAETISTEAQLRVLVPFIEGFRNTFGVESIKQISIDTRDIEVMRVCIEAGISTINDVSGGSNAIYQLIAEAKADYVLMHNRGNPKTMQQSAQYDDVVAEVLGYLIEKSEAMRAAGVAQHKIIWDTGIGFGKLPEHNLRLLARHEEFGRHGYRVLAGVSRKSFIGHITGRPDPADRLIGSLAVQMYLTLRGLDILRVHDVKEMSEMLATIAAIQPYELHPT